MDIPPPTSLADALERVLLEPVEGDLSKIERAALLHHILAVFDGFAFAHALFSALDAADDERRAQLGAAFPEHLRAWSRLRSGELVRLAVGRGAR